MESPRLVEQPPPRRRPAWRPLRSFWFRRFRIQVGENLLDHHRVFDAGDDPIDIRDFARVDWTRVNLDEWLAILYETGHFPTLETLTVEDLTDAGSPLAVQAVGRPDAATRTTQRSDGLDSEEASSNGPVI
jgi:hypothetical protein